MRPHEWSTTPAEADVVDANRPRRVRFADTVSMATFEPWFVETWGRWSETEDETTKEMDETTPDNQPSSSDAFNSGWQQLMDDAFPDDEE